MNKEKYELFTNVHNELIDKLGIDADKYERQDSFSAIIDVENGKDIKDALVDAFDLVYDAFVSDELFDECYNLYASK